MHENSGAFSRVRKLLKFELEPKEKDRHIKSIPTYTNANKDAADAVV